MNIIRLAIAGAWITVSEFTRNQVLLISNWEDYYKKLGLEFVTKPLNGILWIIWSLALTAIMYFMLQKMNKINVIVVTWIIAFPMMWLVMFNLQVLPLSILYIALPLSIIEIVIAVLILNLKNKEN